MYAEPNICDCDNPRKRLATHRTLDGAIVHASAHWLIYKTFWGDTTAWLAFIVVDTKDGVIEWRNGRRTRETENGQGTHQTGA